MLLNVIENESLRGASGLLADLPSCGDLPITRAQPQKFGTRKALKEREREVDV
jgi:hypothetical protein